LTTASGVTEPGSTPSAVAQKVGGAEGQSAGGSERFVQPLEVDHRLVPRGDQEQAALAVLQEQVLGVRAGDRRLDRPRLGDGEHRLVGVRVGPDAERGEAGEQLVGSGGRHGEKLLRPFGS
jgi:hypothetical protein